MFHIVVARYQEDLTWLFDLLDTYPEAEAYVYNDGPPISQQHDRLHEIPGDKVPSEPTKYITYILDHYNHNYSHRVIFLQGDPAYHNPYICNLFKYMNQWKKDYQHLSYWAHPPPWGCAQAIADQTAPNITSFAPDAKVWHDIMDNNFQGEFHYDIFITHINPTKITVQDMANYFEFIPPTIIKKTYAAMFATTWDKIKEYSPEFWQRLHEFIITPLSQKTSTAEPRMTAKQRSCFMEYLWAPIFEGQAKKI